MVMTALGAGVHTGEANTACSVVGSTGVHLRAVPTESVWLNDEQTGYVIPLPWPGYVTQVQTNMASTLNLDWLLHVASDLLNSFGCEVDHARLVQHIDRWLSEAKPGALLYHPYISEAGERGPFVNAEARASFVGLSYRHGFGDMVRAVIEGIGFAARDCYQAMGGAMPAELRLTGGAIRSPQLRQIPRLRRRTGTQQQPRGDRCRRGRNDGGRRHWGLSVNGPLCGNLGQAVTGYAGSAAA
jgi:erythritol kinase